VFEKISASLLSRSIQPELALLSAGFNPASCL
jgi:hypothetical protein